MKPFDVLFGTSVGLPDDATDRHMRYARSWAPGCGTSYDEHEQLCQSLKHDVWTALTEMIEQIPDLSARTGASHLMWLEWNGSHGRKGYWVHCGIELRGAWPPAAQRSAVRVRYLDDDRPTKASTLIELWLTGPSSRDSRLLAGMILDAVQRHGRETGRG